MNELIEQTVRDTLRTVIDPELGDNVVDLNMIRQIDIAAGQVTIQLVLTVLGCPLAGWIIEQIRQVVGALPGVEEVEVTLPDELWQMAAACDWEEWVERALDRRH